MRSSKQFKKFLFCSIGVAAFFSIILSGCQPSASITSPVVTPKSAGVVCRFGPGTVFSSITTLQSGKMGRILGSLGDKTWWEIEIPPAGKTQCWVPEAEVISSGDLSQVPVIPIPSGQVTALKISLPVVIHSTCDNDTTNPISFDISMTTNGPAKVTYHLEVYTPGGTMLLMHSDDFSMTFASAATQTFNTGDAINIDCGKFDVKAIVSAPNFMTAQTSWSIVAP
jgi:uncharacterized protein YraI